MKGVPRTEDFANFALWLQMSLEERKQKGEPVNQKEYAKRYNMPEPNLSLWKRKIKNADKTEDERNIKVFLDKIYKEAISGKNAQYAKLYADIVKLTSYSRKNGEGEKQELDADSIAKAIFGASEELRKQGFSMAGQGMVEVSSQLNILS